MSRRESEDTAVGSRSFVGANEALARTWLCDFECSEAFSALATPVRQSLAGAVRVVAYCFTRRWSSASETPYPLNQMTADDAIDVLTEQLPHVVTAVDSDAIIDGLIEFLVWAAKTNRIQTRDIEYACRRSRHDATAAMKDERKGRAGKSMVLHALQDGVDPADLDRVHAHAIGRGLDPAFVDESLPPGPTSLGSGRWLWNE